MQIPRSAAFVVIAIGVVAMGYGIMAQRAAMEGMPERGSRTTIHSTQPVVSDDQSQRLSTQMPLITLPPHEPLGRTIHVRNEWPTPGSGAQEDPYRDLPRALSALTPGDRLIVWPGRYNGPIDISKSYRDGTPDRPIEVVMAAGALFFGKEGMDAPIDRPLLTVDRSHWHFYELELEPHWMRPTMRLSENIQGITIVSGHMLKGVGHGVEIQDGVSDVLITDTHMHHLGTLRGAKRNFRDPEAAGVAIAPSASNIELMSLVMHHMEGAAVHALNADGTTASAEDLANRNIQLGQINASAMGGKWD